MSCITGSFDNVIRWIKYFEEDSRIYGEDVEFKLGGQILSMLLPRVEKAYIHFSKKRVFDTITDFDKSFTIYLLDWICPYYADHPIEEIDVKRTDEDEAREGVEKGLKRVEQVKAMLDELKELTTGNSFHWFYGENKDKSEHHRQNLSEGILYFEDMLKHEQERISISSVKKYRKKYGFTGLVLELHRGLFGDEPPKAVKTAMGEYTSIAMAFNVLFDDNKASEILQKSHQESENKKKSKNKK